MAGVSNITINQGSDLLLTIVVNRSDLPWDLTAVTVSGKVRATFDAVSSLVDFTIAKTDAVNGEFTIALTSTQTAALVGPGGTTRTKVIGVYDIEISDAGIVTRILEGTVTLSQEATK